MSVKLSMKCDIERHLGSTSPAIIGYISIFQAAVKGILSRKSKVEVDGSGRPK